MVEQLFSGPIGSIVLLGIVMTMYGLAMAVDELAHPVRNWPMVTLWLVMGLSAIAYPAAQACDQTLVALVLRVLCAIAASGVLAIISGKLRNSWRELRRQAPTGGQLKGKGD